MALLTEPKMVRYIGNGQVKDTQAGKDFLNWIYRIYEMGDGLGLMVLEKKDDRTPVGHAGLVPQTIEEKTEMEIGY
ncbi:hypothetical protein [Virgibacillus sp. MG-45]|uniref:hypothetical protein n=1 Tax=Virgibacillus sp. MG-45 TaxID=3102791 RepID=UPI002EDA71F7